MLRMRSGKPGGGKGPLLREDESLTLATGNDQTLFQPTFVRSHTRNSMEDGDRWTERDESLALAAQPTIGIPGSTLAVKSDVPYAVRKLMPVECERLQGLPDGWTEGQKDTPRYKQLGNAVAVPVIEWIALRVAAIGGVRRGTTVASAEEFVYFREQVPERGQHFLTPYTADQIRESWIPYLYARGRRAAGALLNFRTWEIANVFNSGVYSGAGEDLLQAVIARGGKRVTYADTPSLRHLYEKHGFIEESRVPFDLALMLEDHPNYDVTKYGTPDMVTAVLK